jgi:NAD(P)H-hydrate epimerase
MEVVVTSAEMQACDRFAIEKLKIPGLILMENAGRGVMESMERQYGAMGGRSALVFCGKGNNGGDGFVVARHLLNQGMIVTVVLVGKESDLKREAKKNYIGLKKIENKFSETTMLRLVELKSKKALVMLPERDFIIDALFGTGFSGKVKGVYADVIEWINNRQGIKVSIDIPSGVNADNGDVESIAVRANLTVTMGFKKIGLMTYKAMNYTGKIEVVNIGVPGYVINKFKPAISIITAQGVRQVLPVRSIHAHKHSVGKIFVLAGSRGMTGAAAMTALSAMRTGVGTVVLGTPASLSSILAKKLTEVMVEPLPETSEGTLSLQSYEAMQKHLRWSDLVIIGPGISRNSETKELLWRILKECNKPLLIDADGLNLLSEKPALLKTGKSTHIIITPHSGELSRLTGIPVEEIERNRVAIARQTAKQFKLTVVLKGAPTVTSTETGKVFINSTGNPGMATAGSGDVLSGIIGGLWAQGMEDVPAAYSGVFIHGHAGDLAKKEYGERGLMATDIQNLISQSIIEIESAIY